MRNWNFGNVSLRPSGYVSFQRTYEELKHDERINREAMNMGFQRTYEELKPGAPSHAKALPGVFSVPMRNWNRLNGQAYHRNWTVFSVPMRNWNLIRWRLAKCRLLCFQRTYEELKLDRAHEWLQGTAGFQRTYEELKLYFSFTSFPRAASFQRTYEELKRRKMKRKQYTSQSFQRTYEELKLRKKINPSRRRGVFSVPMRNWNSECHIWFFIKEPVFSVPMRNWNQNVKSK